MTMIKDKMRINGGPHSWQTWEGVKEEVVGIHKEGGKFQSAMSHRKGAPKNNACTKAINRRFFGPTLFH